MDITDTLHMGTMGDTRTKAYAMVYCKRLRRIGMGDISAATGSRR
jgi:hypothetical protein